MPEIVFKDTLQEDYTSVKNFPHRASRFSDWNRLEKQKVTVQVPDSSPHVAARSFILQRTVPPAAAQSAAKNYCELPQAVSSPE